MTIALIAATLEEARPLLGALAARLLCSEPFVTYRFDAAGDRPGGYLVLSGMGPVAAAAAARYAIAERGARTILNFGACGSLAAASDTIRPVGSVLAVGRVLDGDALQAPGIALEPGPWRHLPLARLVSVAEPVFGGERRERLAGLAELVDMEGFAVARAAAEYQVKCLLIKGVTDTAAGGERETLQRNLAAVSRRIAAAVTAGLPGLGQVRGGLVGRLMSLIKVEHSIFSLPLLFAGAWIGAGDRLPSLRTVGWVVVAGVAARGLGMVANRILDRDLDALNRRTAARELAAGTMTPLAGWALALFAFGVYLAACAALGPLCLKLSPIPAAMLVGYSLLKRYTAFCHFGIGACMALAPLGAHVAVRGDLAVTAPIILLAAFAFFWISGFDIIYALQDLDSDRATGVRSIPARFGSGGAQRFAALTHALAVVALVTLWWIQGRDPAAGWMAFLSTVAMVAAYIPAIPLPVRFFPVSAMAGVAGAFVPMMRGVL